MRRENSWSYCGPNPRIKRRFSASCFIRRFSGSIVDEIARRKKGKSGENQPHSHHLPDRGRSGDRVRNPVYRPSSPCRECRDRIRLSEKFGVAELGNRQQLLEALCHRISQDGSQARRETEALEEQRDACLEELSRGGEVQKHFENLDRAQADLKDCEAQAGDAMRQARLNAGNIRQRLGNSGGLRPVSGRGKSGAKYPGQTGRAGTAAAGTVPGRRKPPRPENRKPPPGGIRP